MATTVKTPKGFQTGFNILYKNQPQQESPGAGLSDMFEFFAKEKANEVNEAKRKQIRKEINRRYYIANKAKIAELHHKRYIEIAKPQEARKQFLQLLSESNELI